MQKVTDNRYFGGTNSVLKGTTKLYFVYYLHVVIIFFSTGLCKSAFSTYSFSRTWVSSFCVLVFCVSVSLAFNF